MRRREFITLLGGAAAAWPRTASAQKSERLPRVGILMGLRSGDPDGQRWVRRFIQAMRDLGWRNGTSVQMDLRWSADIDQMRVYSKELVGMKPDVIHVTTSLATAEVLRQTKTIPVIFSVVNDPVALGFTQSLTQPGGNATGFTNIVPDMGKEWLTLLKQLAPHVTHAAVMFNPVPGSHFENRWAQFEVAAKTLGITVESAPVRDVTEIEKALNTLGQRPQAGLVVIPDTFFNLGRSGRITALVSRYNIAAIYPFRDFVVAGGLASYAVDIPDLERRSAGYIDRILKGGKPADLPVESPSKFELALNLKAAKQIGLVLPAALIARANEVIE